jgi:GMP synthase (glutamine-hydrolysing)
MRIHYFQHVPFEGLGSIEAWAQQRGHILSVTRWFADETPPPLTAVDAVVVLGGPMNADDDQRYPWLTLEKRWLEQALQHEKRVLGICLGSQLIARVLGARVYANDQQEIGWLPITFSAGATAHLLPTLPPSMIVFHWHGDTFDLPPGATHLASSAGCGQQAYRYAAHVLAFQYHPEATPMSVQSMLTHDDIPADGGIYVQSAATIAAETAYYAENQAVMGGILTRFLESAR